MKILCMLFLENNVDDYKQLVDLKRKLTQKEARPKYTNDSNVNETSEGWLRKAIKRYKDLIKVVRLGRMTNVSKEIEIELKMRYAGMCGKSGVSSSMGDDGDSDNNDGEDIEAYDGFVGELVETNVEGTAAV